MRLPPGPHHPSRFGPMFDTYCWGVYVGSCIDGEDAYRLVELDGHAHNDEGDPWYGWICIIHPNMVLTANGDPSHLLLHELAHLMPGGKGHGRRWRDHLVSLGARSEARKYDRKAIKPGEASRAVRTLQ